MAYSELPWRPFLGHQALNYTKQRWRFLLRLRTFVFIFVTSTRFNVFKFLFERFYINGVDEDLASLRERDGSWSDDEAGYGSHDDRDNVSAGHRFCWLRLQIFQLRSVRKFSVRARVLKASSHRHTRHDKTAAPACRPPPPRHRPGRQLRLAAWPPTRSDVIIICLLYTSPSPRD